MLVATLDGRQVEVRRRWLPWRLRKRKVDPGFSPFDMLGGADDLAGVAFGLVIGIVLFLFGGIVLTLAIFASEALLLLLLLVPLIAGLRIFWVLPWVIEATYGDETLGAQRIRGWRDSEDRIQAIATAYQQGRDPFAVSG